MDLADIASAPFLYITYAVIQAVVFLLLIRWLDLFEREALVIIAILAMWGGTAAVLLSFIGNEVVYGLLPDDVATVWGAAISAPIVEELSKGVALVAAVLLSQAFGKRFGIHEFEGVTDGLVYGAAVGMGFAFTESIFYIFKFGGEGLLEGFEVFLQRADFFGFGMLGHSLYTGFFGAGLGLASWSSSRAGRIGWPALGLGIGMFMHAMHNGLTSLMFVSKYGWENTVTAFSGGSLPENLVTQMNATLEASEGLVTSFDTVFVIAFFAVIALWLRFQRKVITFELAEEVNAGLISKEEWEMVPRYWQRTRWYWKLLQGGHLAYWRQVRNIHAELANLAFMKWRYRKRGGDWDAVNQCRANISQERAQLADQA